MLLKVTLIFSLTSVAICLAWLFPRLEQSPEDDDWEDAPRDQYIDNPARRPRMRSPQSSVTESKDAAHLSNSLKPGPCLSGTPEAGTLPLRVPQLKRNSE
jgi:hypothetical protein